MKDSLRYSILILCIMMIADAQAQPVRRARRGIIISGLGNQTRAMEPFGGSQAEGTKYAEMVNVYYQLLEPEVRVYCMPIPNAVALYCPESARKWTGDERSALDNLLGHLDKGVVGVPLLDSLLEHAREPIYSRTDHHWAPLGAYYAARQLARAAEVPFCDLSHYDADTIRNYVGTMYRFSGSQLVKRSPELFVYYKPRDISYQTSSIRYSLRGGKAVATDTLGFKPSDFFYSYSDGSNAAYLTFMKGDLNTTRVQTETRNKRRLLILKDSYGNALPPFLFYSFEEIHVIDCRYFPDNIIDYVAEQQITDLVFCNNLIHAHNPQITNNYKRYLEQ
ncbi:MAG: hypothetical protein K5683_03240 [Prevotella sp.]|nr:hypothetical protein [Prevotella sp.]